MNDAYNIQEAIKRLGRKQKLILNSLYLSPQPIKEFASFKTIILTLQERGLVQLKDDQVFLTNSGQAICGFWQKRKQNKDEKSNSLSKLDKDKRKESSRLTVVRQAKLEKSNQFLELYKQGLTYQAIGDQHGLTGERVRQILKANPAFHEYLKEREEAEAAAEREKQERDKQELSSRRLAALYPDRVAELWDYEKNGDIKPEDVPAGSVTQLIWLKCPLDGHSWQKKPDSIKSSWDRGASGCPVCAGKKKKAEKQPIIIEIYPKFIEQYWNYEKNNELNLDPEKLTLASNKKAWFKCPHDGNEWQARVGLTINQQWSKGNAGCRVCNGTAERKRGEWQVESQ